MNTFILDVALISCIAILFVLYIVCIVYIVCKGDFVKGMDGKIILLDTVWHTFN